MCSFGSSNASAPTTQFSTQTTSASPQAQAMYNSAWANAQKVSQRPFQPYSYDPNAFVAPMNPVQMQGVNNIASYQGGADPFYQMGANMAGYAGNTTAPQVLGQYTSPYMSQVVDPTRAAIEQQQAFQRQALDSNQIKSGSFGQERGQLMRAVLAGQQNLGLGQALSPLYQDAYKTGLGAAQTDLQRQAQTAQTMGGLGQGYVQSGLGGAQALLGAGTIGQQTQQAGLQALYNQYMLQQQYPFMAAQFLSGTAASLGPGYGGTTSGYQSSMQPLSFFGNALSDPHLKVGAEGEEPEVIGQTHDGQDIYRYRVINPDTGELGPVQIGLMADEVEQRRPDAIGDYKGYQTVDYAKATDNAARLGGGVRAGGGDYADGGSVDDIVRSHGAMYAALANPPSGIVPQVQLPSARLEQGHLSFSSQPQEKKDSFMHTLGDTANMLLSLYNKAGEAKKTYDNWGKKAAGGSVYGEDQNDKPFELGQLPVAHLDAPKLSFASDRRDEDEGGGLGSTLKSAAGIAGSLKTLWDIGSTVGPALMALSDRSLKTGVRPGRADGGGVFDNLVNALSGHGYIDGSTWEREAGEPMDIRPPVHFEAGVAPRPARRAPRHEIAAAAPAEAKFNYASRGLGAAALPSDRFTPFRYEGRYGPVVGFHDANTFGHTPILSDKGFASYDRDPDTNDVIDPHSYEWARLRETGEANRPLGYGIAGFAKGGSKYSDEDLDYLARTLVREAGGEGDRGMEAVGHVIRNRLNSGKYGSSIKDVVTSKNQFEPWNENMRGTKADPRLVDAGSDIYNRAIGVGRSVMDGADDITGGAMNFYNPKVVSPKWAAGKEGLDIGNHRFLDASGSPGAGVVPSAYAAKESRPASDAIDAIASATSGKGVKPVPAADESSPARGIAGFLRGAPAKDMGEKAGDFLTSERFLVPLLAGLGGMASSNSRFLAPAILQGLGAGAQAYMQVPKVEAETALTQAEAENKKALTPKFAAEAAGAQMDNFFKSFMKSPYGNFVFLKDGTPLTQAEYMKQARSGSPPELLGSVPTNGLDIIKKGVETAGGKPAAVEEKPAAPAGSVPSGVYDENSSKMARKEADLAINGGINAEQAAKTTEDYRNYVTKEVTDARENSPYLKELSTTLADAYAQDGWNTPGFQANLRSELSNLVNTLYRSAGGTEDLSSLKSNTDKINKISQLLAEKRGSAAGQHAYAALAAIKSSVPNLEMSPEAGADLAAQLMALQQRAVDRETHYRRYVDDSNGFARDAGADFNDPKRASRYQKEQKVLKDLMLHEPQILKKMMSGSVSPEQIQAAIVKIYGKKAPSEMWRYFAPSGNG